MRLRIPTTTDVRQKTVVLRVDFNVPLKAVGSQLVVADDERITASLPTIEFLLKNQAKVVLLSHLGRPEGIDPKLSLKPVAELLGKLLKMTVPVVALDQASVQTALETNPVVMLENLRFESGEETNDPELAWRLGSLGQVYINDAFSVSHREHASVVAITKFLPSFAGPSLVAEVNALSAVRDNPERPLVAVIGGAKISDKVEAIVNLAHIADVILTGGGVANIFLKAKGLETHKSFVQDAPADLKQKGIDFVHVANDLEVQLEPKRFHATRLKSYPAILYPLDVVAAESPDSTETHIVELTPDLKDTANDENLMYLDIGPKTIQLYAEVLRTARTIFWNGPMGVFEQPSFAAGTREIAKAIAHNPGQSIVGGGDTVAAIDQFGLKGNFSYVSHAGGASLEFLAGKELPGLIPLMVT